MSEEVKKVRAPKKELNSYLVKTKGYQETFSSLEAAQKQQEILKKRAVKNQEKIKIEILEKTSRGYDSISIVKIDESFYED